MNQPESSTESADAISGATSERIKDIVVKMQPIPLTSFGNWFMEKVEIH